jgi:hypothetical protein
VDVLPQLAEMRPARREQFPPFPAHLLSKGSAHVALSSRCTFRLVPVGDEHELPRPTDPTKIVARNRAVLAVAFSKKRRCGRDATFRRLRNLVASTLVG